MPHLWGLCHLCWWTLFYLFHSDPLLMRTNSSCFPYFCSPKFRKVSSVLQAKIQWSMKMSPYYVSWYKLPRLLKLFDVNVNVSVNDEVTWACPELTCNIQGLIWFPWPCRHRFSLRCFNMTILWFPLFVNPNMKRLLHVAWSPPTELLPSCCIFFNSQAKSREI